MAFFSIIIPLFNKENFILNTLQSVFNQSFTDYEIIIVDDCSTDNSLKIVMENSSDKVKIVRHEINKGLSATRNTGIKNATAKYIAFLDADDLWKPRKLDLQIDFLLKNDLPFTFSFYECINESGESLNRRVEAPRNLSYTQLFFCNYVGNLTGIYDVEFFGKIAVSPIRKRQDWVHWLTILKKIRNAKPVPESLAYYRIRENSISASKLDLLKHNFAVYRTFHHYNLVVSLLCMTGFLVTQLIIKPRYNRKIRA